MGERLDRALDLLERLVVAMERLADADRDTRPQNEPEPASGEHPLDDPPRPVRPIRDATTTAAVESLAREMGLD